MKRGFALVILGIAFIILTQYVIAVAGTPMGVGQCTCDGQHFFTCYGNPDPCTVCKPGDLVYAESGCGGGNQQTQNTNSGTTGDFLSTPTGIIIILAVSAGAFFLLLQIIKSILTALKIIPPAQPIFAKPGIPPTQQPQPIRKYPVYHSRKPKTWNPKRTKMRYGGKKK